MEFRSLKQTGQYTIRQGGSLVGFCCESHNLYCVERREERLWLTVYDMSRPISLLDVAELWKDVGDSYVLWGHPRVDRISRYIYVPCGRAGIQVFSCEDDGLRRVFTLTCVSCSTNVAVVSIDRLAVCDRDSGYVCLVNVGTNRVITSLQKPAQVTNGAAEYVSVLGETGIVCYGENTLMTFKCRGDSLILGEVLQSRQERRTVTSITTDGVSNFVITDWFGSVFVLNDKLLIHKIDPLIPRAQDCAVFQSELWVGDRDGVITVLKSQ